jgi:hypothetical protein
VATTRAALIDAGVRPGRGLTRAEAAARLAADGPNELPAPPRVPAWRRLAAQMFHFFALLCWGYRFPIGGVAATDERDLSGCEDGGVLTGADPEVVSERALARGPHKVGVWARATPTVQRGEPGNRTCHRGEELGGTPKDSPNSERRRQPLLLVGSRLSRP